MTTLRLRRCWILIWRVEPDAQALLDQVIPPRTETYSAFLAHLVYKKDNDAAAKVWSALIGLQQPFLQRTGIGYVDYC